MAFGICQFVRGSPKGVVLNAEKVVNPFGVRFVPSHAVMEYLFDEGCVLNAGVVVNPCEICILTCSHQVSY